MHLKTLALVPVLAVPVWLGLSNSPAQDKAPAEASAPMDDMAKMMEFYAKLGTPGEHHKHLEHMIGTFTGKMKHWMEPGTDAIEMTGTCTNEWVLGGRFVKTTFTGDFMGTPFEGIGYFGYDNYKKVYNGFWIDNYGTQMMPIAEGTYDESTTTVTMKRTSIDPMTDNPMHMREVITPIDDDHHTFEMFMTPEGGEEFRSMVIEYIRQ